jgi:hypothetical protein
MLDFTGDVYRIRAPDRITKMEMAGSRMIAK